MFTTSSEVLDFIKKENVEFVDVRFMDLPGVMQHFNVPVGSFTVDAFEEGLMFDGSSIRGFQAIHESDMKLVPDPSTAYIDPFRPAKTLIINFSILDPFTNEPYARDPRNVASRAETYLKSTGIADTAYFGPEAEFYVFDDVRFETNQHSGYYYIDSVEGAWNTGRVEEGGNRGYKTRYKGGYFPVPPVDHFADIRDDMVIKLQQVGLKVERSHHEVGTAGQGEINYTFDTLKSSADDLMKFKYVVKMWLGLTARRPPSCQSHFLVTTVQACTATNHCGSTESHCFTMKAATEVSLILLAGISVAFCTTHRRCLGLLTPPLTATTVWCRALRLP